MPDDRPELKVFPEWGPWDIAGILTPMLSPELRDRLRAWNDIWQNELNPQREIRWPDPEVGRLWMAEGEELVAALQSEIGPSWLVTGDFAAYDPDAGGEGS